MLAGKYRLEASIGKGGMGEVFAASHIHTGQAVAVKVVRHAPSSDHFMQRLQREAVAAGRIRSRFVPQMLDVERTEEGEIFLVMERLHGQSLSDRMLVRGAPLPWSEVKDLGDDLLSGLVDAHAAGVVHRDLKPANIFLVAADTIAGDASGSGDSGDAMARERACILDFGVCKLDLPDTAKLTTTGESVGTIAYMAPEQIRGASKVDERADLYAFGMVVFEALSGRLPYDPAGQMALIASKLERRARTLGELARVPCPGGLDALIARALARSPEERFASAREMREAWRALGEATTAPRFLSTGGAGATSMSSAAPSAQAALTTETVERVAYASPASRVGLALAACALLLASAVVVAALRLAPASEGAPRVEAAIAPRAVDSPGQAASPSVAALAAPLPEPSPQIASDAKDAGGALAPKRRGGWRAGAKPAPVKHAPDAPHISTEPRY